MAAPTDVETARAALAPAIADARPQLLLIQGRSAIALAAAQHAAASGLPLGYIDAGLLPTGPREMNARAANDLATLHFAPTSRARDLLLARGEPPESVVVTGSPGIDALHLAVERLDASAELRARMRPALEAAGPLVVIMAEHAETPVGGLAPVIQLLLVDTGARFLIACEPGQRAELAGAFGASPRVTLTGAVSYLQLVAALREAHVVLTDSSGIEELAPSLGVPVLVMRGSTGRPEGIAAGSAMLVGTGPTAIAAATTRLLAHPSAHAAMANVRSPYGDGLAAWRIASAVRRWFAERR